MSSYYPSFNYMGFNSLKDKNLIVVHFDNGDSGEMETFLSMDSIYTESAYGTRRIDYGARYNSVALIRITVMKQTGVDFTVTEVRDFLRWTTGVRQVSYLDLLEENQIKYSFLGRVVNVLQHKMDARTLAFTLEFESVSPWAYSPIQTVTCSYRQKLTVDEYGVLEPVGDQVLFKVDSNGVLYNDQDDDIAVSSDGVAQFDYLYSTEYVSDSIIGSDNSSIVTIDNKSDDLYTYVYLDIIFKNSTSDYLSIKNTTLNEETIVTQLSTNEIVTLNSGQFIVSDKPNKIFGDTFNFVWPRLGPGINQFVIDGSGEGTVQFKYRYPIKIGDCAIDTNVTGGGIDVCKYD